MLYVVSLLLGLVFRPYGEVAVVQNHVEEQQEEALKYQLEELTPFELDVPNFYKAFVEEKDATERERKYQEYLAYNAKLQEEYILQLEEQRREAEEASKVTEQEKLHGKRIGQEINVEATAYTPYCYGCSGVTRTGLDVRGGEHKVIAVDPRVIPLKAKVEIIINGESWGIYSAEDTGGVIKGNIIDVLHQTKQEAYTFGRKHNVVVKIVELPMRKFEG